MSTKTFDRLAFVRSVCETNHNRSAWMRRPFRSGGWLVAGDGRVVRAVVAKSKDPQGTAPLDRRDQVAVWLEEDLPTGFCTTVAALRKWSGNAEYTPALDRVGTLTGQPINRRLLTHLLAQAPAGTVSVQVRSDRPRLIRICGDAWRGILAPLDPTGMAESLVSACAANVFTP